ncbi:amino acid aminotransferase [Burkholderia cepacia]|uniref:amino acid aminotransferase n=1 Tax=Burkholderia cepacia TaxID=292 RepID=UPI001CF120AA|nr:amino acid aminotransferase [Burkholderia cepacia]MCA8030996.1 aspartate/tyrosine/aromatic aminotransferase [Burkholderia cepacia]
MFSHVDKYAGDSILSLNENFHKDPRPGKVNLTIGIYFDENGQIPLLDAVRQAEKQLAEAPRAKPYLPMAGLASYRKGVQQLVFGSDAEVVDQGRVVTIQTLGGSGALKVSAEFLKRYFPQAKVWLSDPTWDNHRVIFERTGFEIQEYAYYNFETGGLRLDAMIESLGQATRGDVVLLHACCHNPTGVDLTNDQWQRVIETIKAKGLLPLVDMAYQGFGDGLEEDAYLVRELVRQNIPAVVANSFSKNFSLYGERCGGLSILCADADEADCVQGQLTSIVRGIYSNPPTHGAQIVAAVLGSAELSAMWKDELAGMRTRILQMRDGLHELLRSKKLSGDTLSRYVTQRGMFTYTGLTAEQVETLKMQFGVFLVGSGRMCMAALNPGNLKATADAIAAVTE